MPFVLASVLAASVAAIIPGALPETEFTGPAFTAAAPRDASQDTADGGLPDAWDWRDQRGISYMSPVMTQGRCGACVSFAIVAALESMLNIACDSADRTFRLSAQFAFSCGGGSCGHGMKVSDAVDFLQRTGTPDASCFEYAAADGRDVACAQACADWRMRTVEGVTVERPTEGFINVPAIKRALLRGPVVTNMILFEDLAAYREGVYRHLSGNQIGTHAIVLVGWDDAQRAWIARNSLGPDWGEGGYFRIAWDDASLPGRYTWLFNVTAPRERGICLFPR